MIEDPKKLEDLKWQKIKKEASERNIKQHGKSREELTRLIKKDINEEKGIASEYRINKAINKWCRDCKYNKEYVLHKNKKVVYALNADAKCAKYDKKYKCSLIKTKAKEDND